MFGFVGDFAGKSVRQVVLADDDLGVYAEIAGAAENFDDTAGGRGAFAGVANKFGIDDCAVEFRNVRKSRTFAGAIFFGGNKLLTESGREFFAGRKFDFVLNARIVGNNYTAARGVTEEADDGGMRASDNADDAALGAAGTGRTAEAGNFGDDVVAVHGVFDVIARNEEVAVEIGDGDVRNDEAVTVLMENEAAFDFVAGNGFVLGKFLGRRLWRGTWLGGRLLWAGRLAKKEAAVGELFDEASFFQLGEHLKEGAAAGFADLEGAREVFEGGGAISKL